MPSGLRKGDVILQHDLLEEAAAGPALHRRRQFAETFENKGGLGGKHTHPRTARRAGHQGLREVRAATRRDFGFRVDPVASSATSASRACSFGPAGEMVDPETGEITAAVRPVLPSHYKCPQTGRLPATSRTPRSGSIRRRLGMIDAHSDASEI